MGKFNKTGKREMPALNTSSLPDLIFTLLFFFMIVTTMREVTLKVQFTLPQGTELEKLEKKSLVTFIYVGEPTQEYRAKMGTESRIQLNDSYAEVGEVQDFIFQERASMNEGDAAKMTVSLKVDHPYQAAYVGSFERLFPICPCTGIHMLKQPGYISHHLSVHCPVVNRTYRFDISGHRIPTTIPLSEEVFESLQYGRAQLAHGHRLPFGEYRECIHR